MKSIFQLALLLSVPALFLGCASTQKPSLCVANIETGKGGTEESNAYFALLFHNYDRSPQFFQRPMLDCTGTPVLWASEEAACEESGKYGEPLEASGLTPNDLILSSVGPNLKLAWAIVRRFTNGEGMGPVALVENTSDGRIVRAIGTLRAFSSRVDLRLQKVGPTEILVAEGEHCVKEGKPGCHRAARLLPLRGSRFMPEPFTDARGACLGPALVHLSRAETVKLRSGWSRKYEMNTTLTYGTSTILVHEQMAVNDQDPSQPTVPGRLFRRAEVDRTIFVSKDRLSTDLPSLWTRFTTSAQ